MKAQRRVLIALTLINIVVLALSVAQTHSAQAQGSDRPRGRALEIVDDRGQQRATITVTAPVTMDGKTHPRRHCCG